MRRVALPFVLFAVIGFIASSVAYSADMSTNTQTQANEPQTGNAPKALPEKSTDRVVVIYFHRTQRCPTCLRMGSYSEEAVLDGFPKEIKTGAVEFRYVDFQDPKNAEMAKAYKISGPALLVLKIEKNKVAAVENLTEIWTKNRDKKVFLKYVRDNVVALQKAPVNRVVVIYFHRTRPDSTSRRMGSYAQEAVVKGFPKEIKAGTVEFRYVDFQDPKNAAMVKAYKIGGPTLIVLKIAKNKAVAGENLTEIWANGSDKEVFLKYVRDNVAAMQKPLSKETARQPRDNTSARGTR